MQANPNLADNQYVKRVFGVMPKDEMGEVTFDVFVRTAGVQASITCPLYCPGNFMCRARAHKGKHAYSSTFAHEYKPLQKLV